MGSSICCHQVDRVQTMKFDDSDSFSDEENLNHKRNGRDLFSPRVTSPAQENIAKLIHPKTGKNSYTSTALQSFSFQTLPSEQHFTNFVTFQALPSSRDHHSSHCNSQKSLIIEEISQQKNPFQSESENDKPNSKMNIFNRSLL